MGLQVAWQLRVSVPNLGKQLLPANKIEFPSCSPELDSKILKEGLYRGFLKGLYRGVELIKGETRSLDNSSYKHPRPLIEVMQGRLWM